MSCGQSQNTSKRLVINKNNKSSSTSSRNRSNQVNLRLDPNKKQKSMIEFNNQPKQVKSSQSRLDPNKNKKLPVDEGVKKCQKDS